MTDLGVKSRKVFSLMIIVSMVAAGMLVAIPFGTQNARGYITPGTGENWNFDDLVMFSGGAVTGGGGVYQLHEDLIISPNDRIYLMGGEHVDIDPGLGIKIEIMNMGMFDGMTGMGAQFMAPGPAGSWQGFRAMGGNLMLNGVDILLAVDGVYAENTIMTDIRNCMIHECAQSGIQFINVMGGPMIENNQIHGCDVGIYTVDSSSMIFGNWIYWNNVGVYAQGWAGPAIDGNEIYENNIYGVHLWNFDGGFVANNGIYMNVDAGIYIDSSFADIWSNTITGWDALAGSGLPGGNAIEITGLAPNAWHTTISQNTINGGDGDDFNFGPVTSGGHGIHVDNFDGLVFPGPQLVIENNPWIAGGNGGFNNFDMQPAGDGGNGIHISPLPDNGDWMTDQHAVKIQGNGDIRGGLGGDNLAPMDGYSGNGGHGIYVTDFNPVGSLKVSNNNHIEGGRGGDNFAMDGGTGLLDVGDGGDGIHAINCPLGSRLEILGNPEIIGAEEGQAPMFPPDNRGGSGLTFENSGELRWSDSHGRSNWGVVTLRDSTGEISITGVSITDSNANNGPVVVSTNSHNLGGNNENWDFTGKPGIVGVVFTRSSGFNVRNLTVHAYDTYAFYSYNSQITIFNGSLQGENQTAARVNATGGGTITFDNCNVFNSLNGFDFSIGEESRVEIKESNIGTVIADAVRFEFVNPLPDPPDNDTDGIIDFLDNCVEDCEDGIDGDVGIDGDACDAVDINLENNTFRNCSGDGVNITANGNANNTNINSFNNTFENCSKGAAINLESGFSTAFDISFEQDDFLDCGTGLELDASGSFDVVRLHTSSEFCRYDWNRDAGMRFILDIDGSDLVLLDMNGNVIQNQPIGAVAYLKVADSPLDDQLVLDFNNNDVNTNDVGILFQDSDLNQFSEILIRNNDINNNKIGSSSKYITYTGLEGGNHPAPFDIGHPQPYANYYNKSNFQIINNRFENNTRDGIHMEQCQNFDISGNLVANNTNYGISLVDCTGGHIYHNNIIDNVWRQAYDNGDNLWDAGYPAGGNYWSDYAGIDINNGPDQDMLGSDGIGDTPYININHDAYMGWANSSAFPNYAPAGMPDFDQKQAPWMTINAGGNGVIDSGIAGDDILVDPTPGPNGICVAPGPNHILETPPFGDDTMEFAYCGPVSAANALWWLDSKFADHSGIPGDGNDTHSLVKDMGVGDDHDSDNPPLLIGSMADYFQTNLIGDTDVNRMTLGLDQYLVDRGMDANYTVLERAWPLFEQVGFEQQNNSAVILFLGFYDDSGNRLFGHIVTVAGVEMGGFLISLSDPIYNIANPIADLFAYNNATNVSHDEYNALPGAPHPVLPPNCFWLPGYFSGYGIPVPPLYYTVCEHMVAIKHNYTPVDRYPLKAPYEYTEFNITLQLGWNLISLPVRQFDWAPGAVLESINGSWDVIQAYDPATDTWLSTNLHRPAVLNDLHEMNHFNAYWIHITAPTVLTVRGDKFGSPLNMPLLNGWNLVGYPSLVPMQSGIALGGTGYDMPVEAFDGAAPYRISPIGPADPMNPGEGYWVHVPADAIWIVNW